MFYIQKHKELNCMLIKKIDTLDELKEMAFVHYKSWNETYMSMLGEDY